MKGLSSEQIDNISYPDMQTISILLPQYDQRQIDRIAAAVSKGFTGGK